MVVSDKAANAPPATGATSLIVFVRVIVRLLFAASVTMIGIFTVPNEVKVASVATLMVRFVPDPEKLTVIPVTENAQSVIDAIDSSNVTETPLLVPIFADPSEVPPTIFGAVVSTGAAASVVNACAGESLSIVRVFVAPS